MSNIYTGKTVEEAKSTGLAELNLTEEEVEVLVLDQGSKGFFGLGAKPARVQLNVKRAEKAEKAEKSEKSAKAAAAEKPQAAATDAETEKKPAKPRQPKQPKAKKPEQAQAETDIPEQYTPVENPTEDALKAKEFLIGLLDMLTVKATVDVVSENHEKVVFNVVTEDSSSVIGFRGEVLDSLQTLVGAVYNTNKDKYLRVVVDCEAYRTKREKTLVSLAKKLAQKAVATGRKVTLEPMNPYERRIIHSALIDFEGVKTVSEGKEPNRFVAIIPDGYDPTKVRRPSRPGGKGKGGKPAQRGEGVKSAPKSKGSSFGTGVFLGNSLKENKEEE